MQEGNEDAPLRWRTNYKNGKEGFLSTAAFSRTVQLVLLAAKNKWPNDALPTIAFVTLVDLSVRLWCRGWPGRMTGIYPRLLVAATTHQQPARCHCPALRPSHASFAALMR